MPLDTHGCPACPHPAAGPAIQGSPDVNANGRPALRVDDPGVHAACCGANTWTATKGSTTVFINGKAAHRVGDQNRHCGGMGQLVEGSPNVVVGDSGGGGGGSTSRGGGRGSGGTASSSSRSSGGAADSSSSGGASTGGQSSSQRNAPTQVGASGASPTTAAEKTFIELELVDGDGNAVSSERYQISASDGMVFSGRLDVHGRSRVEGVAPGNCSVMFPDLQDEDWSVT